MLMKMYTETQPVEKYLNQQLECSCGRTHYAPIRAIKIGPDALMTLPNYVERFGYRKPYILCDPVTYEIAGKQCETLLAEAGITSSVLVIRHLGYDEATLGEIVLNKPDDCDLMIACGTGQISDILRFSSFKLGLPCFTIPTAAPMDGFSASVGIMNVNNLKATMPAHSTEVIIGDTNILKNAPFRMTLAGFGDLIAKLNALNDWRLDVLVNDHHYCENNDRMVTDYVNDILSKSEKLKERDPEAIGDVMNALLLTGAAISLYGSSRPISGAEHHMSHYWEVLGEQTGKPYAMHGEQAAVGTVLALRMVELVRRQRVDFEKARDVAKQFCYEVWENNIRRTYGAAAETILELERKSQKNAVEGRLRRIDAIEKKWPEIVELFNGVCPSEKLRCLLKELGCPADPKDIGVTPEILKDTLMVCKETRARYTVLQLAWDLELLDPLSDQIIAECKAAQRV